MAAAVLILSPASSALAGCFAHCLLIQRGMEASHKVYLFQSGPRVRVFFVKILARLRLSGTVLILSAKGLGKIF